MTLSGKSIFLNPENVRPCIIFECDEDDTYPKDENTPKDSEKMSKPKYNLHKLIVLNIILIVLMIYTYPQAVESEMITNGAVTILYELGIMVVAISALLIYLKIRTSKQ